MKAVGYVRVSTADQADRGVSLEAQRARIEAYASLYGLELVAVEVDAGESAGSMRRPGLQRAIAMLRRGSAKALVVAKLDRLTRSTADLHQMVTTIFKKAALLSVTEQIDTRTAGGLLVLDLLTSVGQWERRAIGERTRVALSHKRSRGEWPGGRAEYGYRIEAGVDGAPARLAPDEAEQRILARARELRASGLSLRAVSNSLAEAGILARCGRPFEPKALSVMLARAAAP